MRAPALLAPLLLAACGGGTPAPAPSPTADTLTPAQRAFDAAAARMHGTMGRADARPDVAFARGMVPHHRGAIDMARIELRYGRDPEMRRLAQAVINTQQGEIVTLEGWLAKQGGVAGGPPPALGAAPHAHASAGAMK